MRRLVAGMPAPPLDLQTTGELVDKSKNMRCANAGALLCSFDPAGAAMRVHVAFRRLISLLRGQFIAERPARYRLG